MPVATIRKNQRNRALRWSAVLFGGFLLVTQQVYTYGPLTYFDKKINSSPKPQFEGLAGFILRRLDDLGLRGVTASALLIAAIYIAWKFKTWRPLNLALLSLLLLNLIVGSAKLLLGRTKPRLGVALISLTVCTVSLIRHTHWFTDLLGGLFVGSALLVAVIAVDRYVPSKSQLH